MISTADVFSSGDDTKQQTVAGRKPKSRKQLAAETNAKGLLKKWFFADRILDDQDFTAAEKLVIIKLLQHHNTTTDKCCFTSERDLAKRIGIDKSTVYRTIRKAKARELLATYQANGWPRKVNEYAFNWAWKPDLNPPPKLSNRVLPVNIKGQPARGGRKRNKIDKGRMRGEANDDCVVRSIRLRGEANDDCVGQRPIDEKIIDERIDEKIIDDIEKLTTTVAPLAQAALTGGVEIRKDRPTLEELLTQEKSADSLHSRAEGAQSSTGDPKSHQAQSLCPSHTLQKDTSPAVSVAADCSDDPLRSAVLEAHSFGGPVSSEWLDYVEPFILETKDATLKQKFWEVKGRGVRVAADALM